MRIAVFGAGAWGTALALAFHGPHSVVLWARNPARIEAMRRERENRRYLPGVALPDTLELTDDFAAAARGADLHLIVTPLAGLRDTVRRLQQIQPKTPLVWACKGLEAGSGRLPHEIVAEELGTDAPCGVLTGPSFAAEVARGLPTAITLASRDDAFIERWLPALHQPVLRIYANTDLIGAEIGGAIKNVMAIAAGVCDGLGLGLNARAALITRGLAEIARLAVALGGRPETVMGLAGMGDLILTCTGDLSRNRRLGLALGAGQSIDEAVREIGQVVESIQTCNEVRRLAERHALDLPIAFAVHEVLHGHLTPHDGLARLLAREQKPEW